MNHKQRMQKLKEEDPITYYELTNNPTGSNSDLDGCRGIIYVGIFMIVLTIIIYFTCLRNTVN